MRINVNVYTRSDGYFIKGKTEYIYLLKKKVDVIILLLF